MASKLKQFQDRAIQAAEAAGEEMFLGVPDRWYEPEPKFGCENGHVYRTYIIHEDLGHVCPKCMLRVAIIPPEYTSEMLVAELAKEVA